MDVHSILRAVNLNSSALHATNALETLGLVGALRLSGRPQKAALYGPSRHRLLFLVQDEHTAQMWCVYPLCIIYYILYV